MKLTLVKRAILLLHEDGRPHYPFSHYLNKFTNPNTIDLIGQALRIFSAHEIEPVVRAMEGRCLSYDGQTPHRLVLPASTRN